MDAILSYLTTPAMPWYVGIGLLFGALFVGYRWVYDHAPRGWEDAEGWHSGEPGQIPSTGGERREGE